MAATAPHKMDRLLFGDNQFFGINHMSEEKARAGAMRFQKTQVIVDVLDVALVEGVRTFMCTTHDRITEIVAIMKADPAKYADFIFYPGMPYAYKYANAVTEDGYLGTLKRFLPSEWLLDAALRGAHVDRQQGRRGADHPARRRRDEDVRRRRRAGDLPP